LIIFFIYIIIIPKLLRKSTVKLLIFRIGGVSNMAETPAHQRAKAKAAGKSGTKEVKIGKRRLDALTTSKKRATEVERSGNIRSLKAAARRLKAIKAPQKVLQVPNQDMPKAKEAMGAEKVKGTVKNMGETRRWSV
jgi:hypothetical protein